MKQVNGKPKRWQWMLAAGLLLAGLVLQLPLISQVLRGRLAPALLLCGVCELLILWRRTEKFEDLPVEEQKERERADRDERNQVLYEKAAWRCWQVETVVFAAAGILFCLFGDRLILFREDWRAMNRIIRWLLLLYWVRILIFEGVRWWMNRKY